MKTKKILKITTYTNNLLPNTSFCDRIYNINKKGDTLCQK